MPEITNINVLLIDEPQSFACANGFPRGMNTETANLVLAAVEGSIAVRFHHWIAVEAMSHAVSVKAKEGEPRRCLAPEGIDTVCGQASG